MSALQGTDSGEDAGRAGGVAFGVSTRRPEKGIIEIILV